MGTSIPAQAVTTQNGSRDGVHASSGAAQKSSTRGASAACGVSEGGRLGAVAPVCLLARARRARRRVVSRLPKPGGPRQRWPQSSTVIEAATKRGGKNTADARTAPTKKINALHCPS